MIILLIIILLIFYFCLNKKFKEYYNFPYKKFHNRHNPYIHYLRHRGYNRGYNRYYPQYYNPIYIPNTELNEENCRKFYPCDK